METKYTYYIWFECVTDGILWHIARRDSKRTVTSGLANDYNDAVRQSEIAFRKYD